MRFLVLLLVPVLALADPQPFDLAVSAVFEIGAKLQHLLEGDETPDNFLVSPLSITSLIGQLMLGAEGQFRDQLFELLSPQDGDLHKATNLNIYTERNNDSRVLPYSKFHLEMYSLLRHLEKSQGAGKLFTLDQKNAVFYDHRLQLTEVFSNFSRLFYGSQLTATNFSGNPRQAQNDLNAWADKQTRGLIKNIFPSPPAPFTSAVFLSSIYFLAEWEIPFSDILNKVGPFARTETEQVNVTYMLGSLEQIRYVDTPKFSMIGLPYKNNELEMFIILPHKDSEFKYNIKKFAQTLSASEVLAALEKAKLRDVTVKMPRLTLSSSISILEPLLRYKRFKEEPNQPNKTVHENSVVKEYYPEILLSGAIKNGNMRINDIVQEMVFSVNEKGTEAAAIALGSILYSGGQKRFFVDRPFTFFIRHKETTATLFWGTVTNPSSS